ncbi:hypothetical protein PHLCEN_2v6512 [Hermanssonia centrifuga]|uniref:Uncharacterized protein n=1 Tax=Hermanssonia centrifuga TaxID=98765 RepID=A0A2R6NZE3_9APHY|nr:hypothetical protein PHLCEN_2v6512 [Hermanssonia centrifuga]
MESRKRARTEDGELVHAKKRAISDGHDTPIVLNGAEPDADELKDDDNLEV